MSERAVKFVRAGLAVIPILGVGGAGVLLWLSLGVSNSAVQEADAAAVAACVLIGSYTLTRSLRWIVDAFSPPS